MQLAYETFHRVVRTLVAMMLDQALVNHLAVAAFGDFRLDELAVWLAAAAGDGLDVGDRCAKVGGHFGRFCRQHAGLAPDPCDRFAPVAGFALDPALRPP